MGQREQLQRACHAAPIAQNRGAQAEMHAARAATSRGPRCDVAGLALRRGRGSAAPGCEAPRAGDTSAIPLATLAKIVLARGLVPILGHA